MDNKGRAGKEEERGWGLMIKYNQFASDIRIENDFMDFLIELWHIREPKSNDAYICIYFTVTPTVFAA